MRRFVAPGKAVLVGEYAVLLGTPAVVAAVDWGVACRVEPSSSLRIDTPQDDRFVRPALEAVGAPPARYIFEDVGQPVDGGKVGLGGSAAAAVVACLAGATMAGRRPSPAELFEVAFLVHHRVQGSGSGIDVAAAAYGGVFRWEANQATPIQMPAPIHLAYSGSSAATGPRVQTFRIWEKRCPGAAQAFRRDAVALVDGFPHDPVATLREAGRHLGAMAADAGIAYWTPGLRRLCQLAEAHGGGAKPSGAGGGDIVVAMFPDEDRGAAWRRAVASAGLPVLPVRIAPEAQEEPT